MITTGAHSPTLWAGRYPSHPEAIVTVFDADAQVVERSCHDLETVRFLYAQLLRAFDTALAPGAGRHEREQRQLVDQQRHLLGGHPRRDQLGRVHFEIAHRLAAAAAPTVEGGDPRA